MSLDMVAREEQEIANKVVEAHQRLRGQDSAGTGQGTARRPAVQAGGRSNREYALPAIFDSLTLFISGLWKALTRSPRLAAALVASLSSPSRLTLEFFYIWGRPPRRITQSNINEPPWPLVCLAANVCVLLLMGSVPLFVWAFEPPPACDIWDIEHNVTVNEVNRAQKWLFLTIAFICGGALCRAHESQHPLPSALLIST